MIQVKENPMQEQEEVKALSISVDSLTENQKFQVDSYTEKVMVVKSDDDSSQPTMPQRKPVVEAKPTRFEADSKVNIPSIVSVVTRHTPFKTLEKEAEAVNTQ